LVSFIERIRAINPGVRADAGDLILRGGLVVTTPPYCDEGLVAKTVVQLDGDLVMQMYRGIEADVLSGHLKRVRSRVGAVHDAMHLLIDGGAWVVGIVGFVAWAVGIGFENLVATILKSAAGGVALGFGWRYVVQWAVRLFGGRLFRKFLCQGS
jgi:hypothetical protein